MEKPSAKCTGRAMERPQMEDSFRRAPRTITSFARRVRRQRAQKKTGMNLVTGGHEPGRSSRWRGDFFGGTVAALIAVPYGMALSIAIGLRPEAGLYTSIIGGAISGIL